MDQLKKKRRESLLLRELTPILQDIFRDESSLNAVFVTKIELSKNSGSCHVFVACMDRSKNVEEIIEILKLYAPSLRSAVSKILQGSYTPKVIFMHDKGKDKERDLDDVFHSLNLESKN